MPLSKSFCGLRYSGLVHAILNVKPAIIAGQTLPLHLRATSLELGLIGGPGRLHFLQFLNGELPRGGWGVGGGRRRGGGGRGGGGRGGGDGKAAGDEKCRRQQNGGAMH